MPSVSSSAASTLSNNGRFDTLTPQQQEKLKQMWSVLLAAMEIAEPQAPAASPQFNPKPLVPKLLNLMSSKEIRLVLWNLSRTMTIDNMLLRFLRARQFDVPKSVEMLGKTLHWRLKESGLDELQFRGEIGALKSNDVDFLSQLRSKKAYIHGKDKNGRPVVRVTPRLHSKDKQSPQCIEKFTLHLFESTLLMLDEKVDTIVFLFDMTGFSLFNMDYAYVKYILKCFENYYPESLGILLIHNAPWVFSGVWNIIKGWIDPNVAQKIKFTKNVQALQEYIEIDQIPEDLGGKDTFKYEYPEPRSSEGDKLQDHAGREEALNERSALCQQLEQNTIDWVQCSASSEQEVLDIRRDLTNKLKAQYWTLDCYVRAPCVCDRLGQIHPVMA
ncbi:CRAL-TRIO domain-containing protein [Yarrowia sp. C11]|nr:CRAL-TRIO domain-containing protein [Yarrowia sp. C11]KAG5370908.1 CRAL-TRIO domain-containing protein [Yarrowia sp. E02]